MDRMTLEGQEGQGDRVNSKPGYKNNTGRGEHEDWKGKRKSRKTGYLEGLKAGANGREPWKPVELAEPGR